MCNDQTPSPSRLDDLIDVLRSGPSEFSIDTHAYSRLEFRFRIASTYHCWDPRCGLREGREYNSVRTIRRLHLIHDAVTIRQVLPLERANQAGEATVSAVIGHIQRTTGMVPKVTGSRSLTVDSSRSLLINDRHSPFWKRCAFGHPLVLFIIASTPETSLKSGIAIRSCLSDELVGKLCVIQSMTSPTQRYTMVRIASLQNYYSMTKSGAQISTEHMVCILIQNFH